jgi:hypothetical protein
MMCRKIKINSELNYNNLEKNKANKVEVNMKYQSINSLLEKIVTLNDKQKYIIDLFDEKIQDIYNNGSHQKLE